MTIARIVMPQPRLPPCQRCEKARESRRIRGNAGWKMNAVSQARYNVADELLCGRHAQIKALGILLEQERGETE